MAVRDSAAWRDRVAESPALYDFVEQTRRHGAVEVVEAEAFTQHRRGVDLSVCMPRCRRALPPTAAVA